MENTIASYKCPCCNAPLNFSAASGKMKCEYCDSELDIEAVREFNEAEKQAETAKNGSSADSIPAYAETRWDDDDMNVYSCPFCGARIVAEANAAASTCPYCDNPMLFEDKLSGAFKPDVLIPFKVTKEEAEAALKRFYEKKFFLPKSFKTESRLQKIKGVYVPFWIYDCNADARFSYDAVRIRTWSDARYVYTKTSHYLAERRAKILFEKIPADGSSKADDAYMESIEPYRYEDMVSFDKAYLSGFLADKYDVASAEMQPRVEARISKSAADYLRSTVSGYDSVSEKSRSLDYSNTTTRYGLFPVWMLNTSYKGKLYSFAMNGQTGKMVGNMPCEIWKYWATFAAIVAAVMLAAAVLRRFLL